MKKFLTCHCHFAVVPLFLVGLFVLINPSPAIGQVTFTNNTSITVNDNAASAPYGTQIAVSACCAVARVEVTINNITHDEPDDLDIKLVGPTGIAVDLMRDSGGATTVTNQTWTFDDRDPAPIPDAGPLATGVYKPSSLAGATGNMPAPAPAGVQDVPLSAFIGSAPSGNWTLYVSEDSATGVGGTIAGGWTITITLGQVFTNAAAIAIPGAGTSGVAGTYPSGITVSGLTFPVTKVSVRLNGLTHGQMDDVGFLLVGPQGQQVLLASDRGGDGTFTGNYTFDSTATTAFPDTDGIGTNAVEQTTYAPAGDGGDNAGSGSAPANLPAPAPASPYSTTLAAFNGTNANGTWNLYVNDDTAGGGTTGSMAGGWTLIIEALAPTAANVSISGRVTTSSGRGISGARLTVSGGTLQNPIMVITNPFGFYHIEDVEAGHAYLIEISAKRYTFDETSRVVSPKDNVTGFDFVSIE